MFSLLAIGVERTESTGEQEDSCRPRDCLSLQENSVGPNIQQFAELATHDVAEPYHSPGCSYATLSLEVGEAALEHTESMDKT